MKAEFREGKPHNLTYPIKISFLYVEESHVSMKSKEERTQKSSQEARKYALGLL